jgi:hypothetical protein
MALREERGHVVREQVVSDLTQLRDSCFVLPGKFRVGCRGCIRGKDVPTNLFPICQLLASGVFPGLPQPSDLTPEMVRIQNVF